MSEKQFEVEESDLDNFIALFSKDFLISQLAHHFKNKENRKSLVLEAKDIFEKEGNLYLYSDKDLDNLGKKALEIVISIELRAEVDAGNLEMSIGAEGEFHYKITDKGVKKAEKIFGIKNIGAKKKNVSKKKIMENKIKKKKTKTKKQEPKKKITKKKKPKK